MSGAAEVRFQTFDTSSQTGPSLTNVRIMISWYVVIGLASVVWLLSQFFLIPTGILLLPWIMTYNLACIVCLQNMPKMGRKRSYRRIWALLRILQMLQLGHTMASKTTSTNLCRVRGTSGSSACTHPAKEGSNISNASFYLLISTRCSHRFCILLFHTRGMVRSRIDMSCVRGSGLR
jgi:hypothetical protein